MSAGRPSKYTDELADTICEEIANGKSLKSIVNGHEGMPRMSTVFKWLVDIPEFSERYAKARQAQADVLFEEILDIADESHTTTKVTGQGEEAEEVVVYDAVAVARNRLRVDARKWMAGKLRPKKYGERLELAGDPDNPLKFERIQRTIVEPRK
jgi:hypothetical protein